LLCGVSRFKKLGRGTRGSAFERGRARLHVKPLKEKIYQKRKKKTKLIGYECKVAPSRDNCRSKGCSQPRSV